MRFSPARGLFVIALTFPLAFATLAKEPPRPALPSVVDYFLLLPPDAIPETEKSELRAMVRDGRMLIDKENGYLSSKGQGDYPFEAALFRYRDGRPLLLVSFAEADDPERTGMLRGYFLGPNGRMLPVDAPLLPDPLLPDASSNQCRVTLPRHGRTVVARAADDQTGKTERRFTWNGERFVSDDGTPAVPGPPGAEIGVSSKPGPTVVDYFLMLPPDTFKGASLQAMYEAMETTVDEKGGYLHDYEGGDGGKGMQAALFRFRDGTPLLAVAERWNQLQFYVPGSRGRMKTTERSILPVANGAGYNFRLSGVTVGTLEVFPSEGSEMKTTFKLKWDGARFVRQVDE